MPVIVLRLCLCSLFILAGVSQALPAPTVLLEQETNGGRVPPDHIGWGEKVTIFTNGQVVLANKSNENSQWQTTPVAQLTTDMLNKLSNLVANIQSGVLEFPDEPECADAPTTNYTAKKADGSSILFAQHKACKTGYIASLGVENLATILDGLVTFNYLDQ